MAKSDASDIGATSIKGREKRAFIAEIYHPPWASHDNLLAFINELSTMVKRDMPV